MPTPTELARDALIKIDLLRLEFDILRANTERLNPQELRERLAVLEEKLKRADARADELDRVQRHLAVLDDRVTELKTAKSEAEKRQWQFVYISAGAVASLVVALIAQLVLALRK